MSIFDVAMQHFFNTMNIYHAFEVQSIELIFASF